MSSDAAKPAVLCAGRIYCDLVFTGVPRLPSLGSETFAEGISLHAGGGAFNTAAAFSVLGQTPALLGYLPAAPFDRPVLEEARALSLDMSLCATATDCTQPQVTVAMALGGDRAFLTHLSGEAVPYHNLSGSACRDVRHLHIGELTTLRDAPWLASQARGSGWTVSLDCGWDDTLMQSGGELADRIASVDVFLPNDAEYAALKASGLPDNEDILTVVKSGRSGAFLIAGEQRIQCPALSVDVVDATGAGDAFNGGFLTGWLDGQDLFTCLENGNRCGASAVQFAGGTAGLLHARDRLKPISA